MPERIPVEPSRAELATYLRVDGHPAIPDEADLGRIQLAINLVDQAWIQDCFTATLLLTISIPAGQVPAFLAPARSPSLLFEHPASRRLSTLTTQDDRKRYPDSGQPRYDRSMVVAADGSWQTYFARLPCQIDPCPIDGHLFVSAYLLEAVSNILRLDLITHQLESFRHDRPDPLILE